MGGPLYKVLASCIEFFIQRIGIVMKVQHNLCTSCLDILSSPESVLFDTL